MKQTVTFYERGEARNSDINDLQAFTRATFDDMFRDAVTNNKGFAGFEVTQTSPSEISVAGGRFYSAGAMYYKDAATVLSVASQIPLVTKKKVAVVVWGVEQDTNAEPIDFIVNVDTGETEPQVVTTRRQRSAQLQAIGGIEAPDPQSPGNLDAAVLVVGYVTLSTAGIVAIEPAIGNRLPSVGKNAASITSLEAWKSATEPRIATIVSEIADLKNRYRAGATTNDMFTIAADVARLKDIAGLPDTYSAYAADRYLSDAETDTGDLTLLCTVEEGIRFSPESVNSAQMSVFNPFDANMKMSSGLVLPAYDNVRRLSVVDYVAEASISQYGYQTYELIKKEMSRTRIRYGSIYTYCTNSAWWRSGNYDPATHIFRKGDETFQILDNPDTHGGNVHFIRAQQFWQDTYLDPYWELLTVNHSITGAQVGQTFLNAQDGWLTQVSVWFTRLAASGNVNLAICELTSAGTPDRTKAIMVTTVAYADLHIGWTSIPIPATFLRAGMRYAICVTTNADHWVGMASGNKYAQGTFFYSTDGVFYAGDLTRDLMFALDFAQFRNPRVEIQMSPLQLSGGIAAIDILAPMVQTEIAKLHFEVQVGGHWRTLDQITPNILIGLPALLPLRAVFEGTTDVHAGLQLSGSVVKVQRPRTTFHHPSTPRTLPAQSSEIEVRQRYESWNNAHHAATCKLDIDNVIELPDVTETVTNADGSIERRYVFNIAAPTDHYRIITDGTTTTALDTFHVAERVDLSY
jgi:hypothetical protein